MQAFKYTYIYNMGEGGEKKKQEGKRGAREKIKREKSVTIILHN